MNKKLFMLAIGICSLVANGQDAQKSRTDYRNFPIVLTLQFHSLAMPLKDFGSHFKNIGVGIGTEVSLNGRHDWVQQFGLLRYRNKTVGNGWFFNTQTAYRPWIGEPAYGEIRMGIGYWLASKPSSSWVQKEGKWTSEGKKGKGMLAIPVGIGLGYHSYEPAANYVAPFAGYQVNFLKGYAKDLPWVTMNLLQAGAAFHPKW